MVAAVLAVASVAAVVVALVAAVVVELAAGVRDATAATAASIANVTATASAYIIATTRRGHGHQHRRRRHHHHGHWQRLLRHRRTRVFASTFVEVCLDMGGWCGVVVWRDIIDFTKTPPATHHCFLGLSRES